MAGAREASWPLVRSELQLSYVQVGLLLSLPGVVAAVIEPAFGVLADAGWRRRLMIGGGIAFAVALALMGVAWSFLPLLVATVAYYPASGALVSTAQASLMDLRPEAREQGMARWNVAGSIGAVLGPLALAAAIVLRGGWRLPMLVLAIVGLAATGAAALLPATGTSDDGDDMPARSREALAALRDLRVLRWLALLQVTELGSDVFAGFIALYVADVAHGGAVGASLSVAVWTGAGLLGDVLLVAVLTRASGLRCLQATAIGFGVLFPAFLLVPGLGPKLALMAGLAVLHTAWYPVLMGRLYDSLPGRSGTAIALASGASIASTPLPLVVGAIAAAAGLGGALWVVMAAPVALLILLPRR